jgi:hypothetical protein
VGLCLEGKKDSPKDKATGGCVEGNATAAWCFLFHKCFGLDNICHVIALIVVYNGGKSWMPSVVDMWMLPRGYVGPTVLFIFQIFFFVLLIGLFDRVSLDQGL